MPVPDFVLRLRDKIGRDPLWLPGITAVVLRADEVLLVRRSDNGEWGPVTGIVDPGEHPVVAAPREVMEETGVQCHVEALVSVNVSDPVVHVNGDRAQYLDHTFRCRYDGGDAHPADDESVEVRWFRSAELPSMGEHLVLRVRDALEHEPGDGTRLRP